MKRILSNSINEMGKSKIVNQELDYGPTGMKLTHILNKQLHRTSFGIIRGVVSQWDTNM